MDVPVENVDGHVLEEHTHEWSHHVEHSIRWDYALLALAVLAGGWWLFGGGGVDGSQEPDEDPSQAL